MTRRQRPWRRIRLSLALETLEDRCVPNGHSLAAALPVAEPEGDKPAAQVSVQADASTPSSHDPKGNAYGLDKQAARDQASNSGDTGSTLTPFGSSNSQGNGKDTDNGQDKGNKADSGSSTPATTGHAVIPAATETSAVTALPHAGTAAVFSQAQPQALPAAAAVQPAEAARAAAAAPAGAPLVAFEQPSAGAAVPEGIAAPVFPASLLTAGLSPEASFSVAAGFDAAAAPRSDALVGGLQGAPASATPPGGGQNAGTPVADAVNASGGTSGVRDEAEAVLLELPPDAGGGAAEMAALLPGPEGAALLFGAGARDLASLDEALRHFLGGVEQLGGRLAAGTSWSGLATWAVAGIFGAAALELGRRRRLRRPGTLFADGAGVGWLDPEGPPGL
jgi:hypothetical protein